MGVFGRNEVARPRASLAIRLNFRVQKKKNFPCQLYKIPGLHQSTHPWITHVNPISDSYDRLGPRIARRRLPVN